MTLEYEDYGGRSDKRAVRIVECPFCNAPIDTNQAWPWHWEHKCPENEANQ